MLSDGRASLRPAGYLGPEIFDRYRDACGGSTYNRETRAAFASIDSVTGIALRLARAGFRLDTAPEITAAIQAREARARADVSAADERTRAVSAALEARGLALFPFQADGVTWLAPRLAGILADDMGLGKTIQALTAAPARAPVVVVCPSVAKGVWAREALRWRPDLIPVVLSGRGTFRWPRAGEMVVVNYDILPGEIVDTLDAKGQRAPGKKHVEGIPSGALPGTVLIADEAHVLKGDKTARTMRFRALRAAIPEGRSWLLTATPLLNRPKELWSLLQTIGLEKVTFGSWPSFLKLMGAGRGSWGTEWGTGAGIDADRVAPKLREVMLRRMKRDVLDQLPAKVVEVIDVELDAQALKALDKIKAELAEHGIDLATAVKEAQANNALAFEMISRARALLATAKTAAAMEIVDEIQEAGEPVIVFSAHRAPIAVFAAREGWATITGDTSTIERTQIEEKFQRGELKGIAGTIKAMGVAITLTRACEEVFVDAEWTPALNEQAEDRCNRIGQTRSVHVRYLRANHEIDERVYELNEIKRGIIARTTDAAIVKGAVAAPASVLPEVEAAKGSSDRAEREAEAEALAIRVRAEREAFARDTTRRRATVKSEAASANRGWNIAASAFATPERAPAPGEEAWAAEALAQLAACDADHARARNDEGFSQADTHLGHALAHAAALGALNDGEWAAAIQLARRYPRQVGRHEAS